MIKSHRQRCAMFILQWIRMMTSFDNVLHTLKPYRHVQSHSEIQRSLIIFILKIQILVLCLTYILKDIKLSHLLLAS